MKQKIIMSLLATFVFMLAGTSVCQGQISRAEASSMRSRAYNYYTGKDGYEKDYAKALNLCRDLVKRGSQITQDEDILMSAQDAAYYAGDMLHEGGYGIEKNNTEAIEMYKKGYNLVCKFKLGWPAPEDFAYYLCWVYNEENQYANIAELYREVLDGYKKGKWPYKISDDDYNSELCHINIFASHAKNKKYYKEAAELYKLIYEYRDNGSYPRFAAYYLAKMYEEGKGVSKSERDYLTWMKRSANLGDYNAMYCLGNYYKNVNKDESIYWYKKAADGLYKDKEEVQLEYSLAALEALGVFYHPEDSHSHASTPSSHTHTTVNNSQSSANSGPEYGYRDVWVDCYMCHGDGKCPTCHGTGWCYSVYGNELYKCVVCYGTGTCQTCYGMKGHTETQIYQIR